MTRRILAGCLLCALALTLAGCWDNQEPRRRAYVLGMAVDPAGAGEMNVAVQIPLPERGSQQQAQPTARDYYVVSGSGPSVMDALTTIQTKVSRELFFGQMRSLVLSDQLTAEQVEQLVNAMERNPDIEETIFVLLTRGSAREVMQVQTPQERLPALYFNHALESVQRRTQFRPVQIWEFWKIAHTSGWEPFLPVVQLSEQQFLALSGIAVYHGYDLRGILTEQETSGYLYLAGETRGGVVTMLYKEKPALVRSLQARRQLSVRFEGDRPVFDVVLRVTGEVAHVSGRPVTSQVVFDLERLTGANVEGQVEAALRALQQKYRSDVLGLGKLLYYRYPEYFDRINWDSVFPTARVNVKVVVELARFGMMH